MDINKLLLTMKKYNKTSEELKVLKKSYLRQAEELSKFNSIPTQTVHLFLREEICKIDEMLRDRAIDKLLKKNNIKI